jgi:hypothetical protein
MQDEPVADSDPAAAVLCSTPNQLLALAVTETRRCALKSAPRASLTFRLSPSFAHPRTLPAPARCPYPHAVMLTLVEDAAAKSYDYIICGAFVRLACEHPTHRDASQAVAYVRLCTQRCTYADRSRQTAGLCLAARLSEDPNTSVLVLEAGEANLNDAAIRTSASPLECLTLMTFAQCARRRMEVTLVSSRTTG